MPPVASQLERPGPAADATTFQREFSMRSDGGQKLVNRSPAVYRAAPSAIVSGAALRSGHGAVSPLREVYVGSTLFEETSRYVPSNPVLGGGRLSCNCSQRSYGRSSSEQSNLISYLVRIPLLQSCPDFTQLRPEQARSSAPKGRFDPGVRQANRQRTDHLSANLP
jgi:hypothetical protein